MNEKDYNAEEENLENLSVEGEESLEEDTPDSNTANTNATDEEDLNIKLDEANDKYARLLAEFDNYKKRTSREKIELIQSAGKDIINRLLPTLDDFDRALSAMATAQDVETVKQGVELVNNKLRKTLEQQGLKEMQVKGETFDSEYQEAITAIPAPSEDLKNKVIDVVEKGYTLNDKVIRYAKVVIGQ